jgi:hypothetical protein
MTSDVSYLTNNINADRGFGHSILANRATRTIEVSRSMASHVLDACMVDGGRRRLLVLAVPSLASEGAYSARCLAPIADLGPSRVLRFLAVNTTTRARLQIHRLMPLDNEPMGVSKATTM